MQPYSPGTALLAFQPDVSKPSLPSSWQVCSGVANEFTALAAPV